MSNYNEILLFIKTAFDLVFLSFISIFGIEGLIGTIALNLIIVSLFGSVLTTYFGFITNEANGFYAVALFGLILIYEKYGHKATERAVWVCILLLIAFLVYGQLNSFLVPNPLGHDLQAIFQFNLRIVGASLLGFAIASRLLIYFYVKLPLKSIYTKSIVAQMLAQLVDTIIFFTVGFAGIVTSNILYQTILTGLVIKYVTILLTFPFFFFIKQRWIKDEVTEQKQ